MQGESIMQDYMPLTCCTQQSCEKVFVGTVTTAVKNELMIVS